MVREPVRTAFRSSSAVPRSLSRSTPRATPRSTPGSFAIEVRPFWTGRPVFRTELPAPRTELPWFRIDFTPFRAEFPWFRARFPEFRTVLPAVRAVSSEFKTVSSILVASRAVGCVGSPGAFFLAVPGGVLGVRAGSGKPSRRGFEADAAASSFLMPLNFLHQRLRTGRTISKQAPRPGVPGPSRLVA